MATTMTPAHAAGILAAVSPLIVTTVPLLFVMAVFVTVVLMMFLLLFIVPGGSLPFHIHPAISFDIVRTARVNHDVYSWRCRQETTNADIHIRRAWQSWRGGKPGLGFIEAEGKGDCCH